jgi:hypothetical protein
MAAASAEELKAFLAERDVSCPRCQYNLKGLEKLVCPECGEPLDLAIVASVKKKRPSPWLRQATHPAFVFAALMLAGIGLGGGRGVALAVAIWLCVILSLRVVVPSIRRYWSAPLMSPGDWLWRAFVMGLAVAAWLLACVLVIALTSSIH